MEVQQLGSHLHRIGGRRRQLASELRNEVSRACVGLVDEVGSQLRRSTYAIDGPAVEEGSVID